MRFCLAFLFLLNFAATAGAQSVDTSLPLSDAPADSKALYNSELLYKVRFGGEKDVHYLLSKGADVTVVNENGWPLVTIAALRRDGSSVPIMRELIKAGADINQGGKGNMYPVVVAARNGDIELMNFLIDEAHADYTKKDPNGVSARDIAVGGGYTAIADKLDALEKIKKDAASAMVSPERKKKLSYDLLFDGCANEYMTYYFQSKQDNHSDEEIKKVTTDWQEKYSAVANDLQNFFHVPTNNIVTMTGYASQKIFDQLEELISNRNRREHQIGTAENLNKRCGAFANDLVPYFDTPEKYLRHHR